MFKTVRFAIPKFISKSATNSGLQRPYPTNAEGGIP